MFAVIDVTEPVAQTGYGEQTAVVSCDVVKLFNKYGKAKEWVENEVGQPYSSQDYLAVIPVE